MPPSKVFKIYTIFSYKDYNVVSFIKYEDIDMLKQYLRR